VQEITREAKAQDITRVLQRRAALPMDNTRTNAGKLGACRGRIYTLGR
jgi:hypothetical protein